MLFAKIANIKYYAAHNMRRPCETMGIKCYVTSDATLPNLILTIKLAFMMLF